ncbi:c-type cytochrome domain-containing protein [Portibacter marinus]|uniref:c-type cytochrome domain-containing protein n=1 Tax=Portibacter marinus TaxID=2898660 RepID=UPI001F2B1478|nr:c-type cytochrome domain-containing protein [Portibacter marinus]
MIELLGRLHPLVLHLPIGILALAYILEVYARFSKDSIHKVQSVILLFSGISATVAILTGLLLIRSGDYSGALVNNHKWVAIALGVVTWTLYFLQLSSLKHTYHFMMVSSAVLLGVTGHLGGTITHGEDFLFKKSGPEVRPDIEAAVLYKDIIHPIFEDKCISCHNPSKLKGELDMSEVTALLMGGEDGKVILPENPLESPLWKHINLPLSDDEHMPPDGKDQLTQEDLELIHWWLKSGAKFDRLAKETEGFANYESQLEKYLAPPEVDIFAKVEQPDSSALLKLQSKGYSLYPTHNGSSAVYVNLSGKDDLTKRDIKAFYKIKQNVAHLNLANSGINNEMLNLLSKFKHIRKLELQNTSIGTEGLKKLKDFKYLEILNLYNTKVDSGAIDKLTHFPQLRTVYVGKTDMNPEQLDQLYHLLPRLEVIGDVGTDLFKDAALRSPVIEADSEIFQDSVEISLVLNFKDVDIKYIINDGDTVDYTGPFVIYETSEIKTLAQKEGWKSSEVNSKNFIKKGLDIANINLKNRPHERYSSFAKKVLIDEKVGSDLFSDGAWVGYEGEHASMVLELQEATEVSNVTVGVLEATGSYIFYPKAYEISISEDGKNFKKMVSQDYAIAKGPSQAGRKNMTFNFAPSKAKSIRLDIKSHLVNPEWHAAPGAKNWIFIDEIIIN